MTTAMTTHETLSPQAFVAELEALKDAALEDFRSGQFGRLSFGDPEQPPEQRPEVVALLKAMVYPERIASDILARRIPSIPDLDIKGRVAEQVAEELEHLDILRRMLTAWGEDPDEKWHDPLPELVAVFNYVDRLETLAEFFTANFIGESLLLSANLRVMRAVAPEAFATYLDVSIPDEVKHVQLNREAIARYATTGELQARAHRRPPPARLVRRRLPSQAEAHGGTLRRAARARDGTRRGVRRPRPAGLEAGAYPTRPKKRS